MFRFTKLLISLFVIAGFGTVQAYRLSEYAEYKQGKKLCMKRHSAESCARTAYLFHRLYNEPDSPLGSGAFRPAPGYKLKGDDKRKYDSYFKENAFYKLGCSLGDNIQCYKHDINTFKIRIVGDYSNYASGLSALKYKRKRELSNEIYRLEDKYIEGVAETRIGDKIQVRNEVFGAWYKKTTTVTIDEIKRQKANGSLQKKKKRIPSSQSKILNSITTDEKHLFLSLKSFFEKNPKAFKRYKSLPESQQRKIFYSLKGNRFQIHNQLSRALRITKSSVKSSSKLNHSHGGRSHSHKLPQQGKAHSHGNGAIGR